MSQLNSSNLETFIARFYHGYDSVIRRCQIDMETGTGKYCVMIVLYLRDAEATADEGWVELQLTFEEVDEYRLSCTPYDYTQVLSDGFSVIFTPYRIFVDFTADSSDNVSAARRSSFYVGAKSCRWETTPASPPQVRPTLVERLSSFLKLNGYRKA